MTNKTAAAVFSTAAKLRNLAMETYLHAAALLLVGATLMPALADSALSPVYRPLTNLNGIVNPPLPSPRLYGGKTEMLRWTAQTPSEIASPHMTPFQVCKATHTMDPNAGANRSPDGSYNPTW
jgi:hypothetical protein